MLIRKHYKPHSPQINMEQQPQDQVQFLLADFNTRLRELEEKNRLIKERVLLLGKNLLTSREQISIKVEELKKQSIQMQRDLKELNSLIKSILSEIKTFVKKDEIVLLERMLKDFQPLEFVREKDVQDMINEKQKQIKTIKTKK